MNKDMSYYFNNCNSLNEEDIKKFIILVCNEEAKKLNINTNINIVFSYYMGEYDGELFNNFNVDRFGKFILPLKTSGYTLKISEDKILSSYFQSQNQFFEIYGDMKIPSTLTELFFITGLCAHEVRHAFQFDQIKDNKVDNIESILWLKEEIVRNYFNDIYTNNYNNYFLEQDAYNYEQSFVFELLSKHSKLDKEILEKYKGYLRQHEIVNCSNKNYKTYFNDLDNPLRKRIGTAYITELFNQIVKELPKQYISTSLLKYEYNNDGSKKSYIELMEDKEKYKSSGQNLDELYDFIVDCDYNLQVQKFSLKLKEIENSNISNKEILKEKYIKKLKKAYATQEFSYKNFHTLIQKHINLINKNLSDLSLKNSHKQISNLDEIEIRQDLLNKLSYYRSLEIQLLTYIKDYKFQKEEFLKQEKTYSENMELIRDYKNKKGILDVIKNGMVIDITDYNKLIALVIKELNSEDIDNNYKEYLLKVQEAIQRIYFPTTLEVEKKVK